MFYTVFFISKAWVPSYCIDTSILSKMANACSPNLYMFHVEYFSLKGLDICCLLVLIIDL